MITRFNNVVWKKNLLTRIVEQNRFMLNIIELVECNYKIIPIVQYVYFELLYTI